MKIPRFRAWIEMNSGTTRESKRDGVLLKIKKTNLSNNFLISTFFYRRKNTIIAVPKLIYFPDTAST